MPPVSVGGLVPPVSVGGLVLPLSTGGLVPPKSGGGDVCWAQITPAGKEKVAVINKDINSGKTFFICGELAEPSRP